MQKPLRLFLICFCFLTKGFSQTHVSGNIPPAISYANNNFTYYVGQPISPATAINNGGIIPANYINNVTTFAGSGLLTLLNGTGTAAAFYYPAGLTTDGSGNIYVADANNGAIRKVTPAGVVTTFVSLTYPTGITADAAGNLYVTDEHYNAIRKIAPNGSITTFAGTQPGDLDGTGTSARLFSPSAIVADASGNLFVTDEGNHKIKKITPAGVVTTMAGSGISAFADGTGTSASFKTPQGITVDAAGNLYVVDKSDFRIRKITPAGVVSTFAGSGATGTADGTGTAASFISPTDITIDAAGNLYVTDYKLIRKITPAGVVSTIAGNTSLSSADGIGTAASFNNPWGITVDKDGNLIISDSYSKLRKLALTGYAVTPALPAGLSISNTGIINGTPTAISASSAYTVTAANANGSSTANINIGVSLFPAPQISYKGPQVYTINAAISALSPTNNGGAVPANIYNKATTVAGSGAQASTNGTGTAASFNFPAGLVTYGSDLFVADANSNTIRKVSSAGVVTTLAGSNGIGYVNSTGTSASFSYPTGITVDQAGNLYIADQNNQVIRKVTQAGVVTTFAGTHFEGHTDGAATVATFSYPTAVVADAQGNLFVTEEGSSEVRKITPGGVVSTFAGNGVKALVNGTGSGASFFKPQGITIDALGNLYVADWGNYAIRKITPAGLVTTLAGSGASGMADGQGSAASFTGPMNITTDQAGNLYVTDQGSQGSRIRMVTPSGVVTTLAGNSIAASTDGIGTAASFYYPWGITTNDTGDLYISDRSSNKIRKLTITGYAITPALPAGLTMNTNGTISGTPTQLSTATDYKVTAYNVGGSSSANVNITVNKIITRLAVTIPADATYGDTDISPVYVSNSTVPVTFTSGSPNVATIVNNKIHIIGAGLATIIASQAGNDIYEPTVVTFIVKINPQMLTVTANDAIWSYGKSADLAVTYKGFVNGDNASKLTTQPTVTTNANIKAPVAGIYELLPGGGVSNNYAFTYVKGKLTITLSANSFKISGTSVTCKGSNNGIITVSPATSLNYTAVVTGGGLNQTYHLNSTLLISNLMPATYHICVSADSLPAYQQCSDVIITEPKDLAVYATVNKTVNTVTLALTGADNYSIKINGTEYQTTSNAITLPLTNGSNKISVSTDRLCQGTFEQLIDLSGITAPYPNPFQSILYVNLGEQIPAVATISIFNMTNGRQVLSQKFNNQSGVVRLDVAGLQPGVYTLNLTLDGKLSTFKIVKQ